MEELSIYDATQEDNDNELKRWKVTNDKEAEWVIEKAEAKLVEVRRFRMAIENKIMDLKDKLERLDNEEQSTIEWRNSFLLEYFESVDDKFKKKTKTLEKYRLPSGEIVKKFPAPEYKRNEVKLLEWVKGNKLDGFIEVKETVKWAELKKGTIQVGNNVVLEETGEVVEGVELIERPPVIEFKEA